MSDETNSLFNEYLICSTNSPSKAYCFIILFKSSTEVCLPTSKFKTTNEPFGTGTRIAFEVNLPAKLGNAFATAEPAPVSVITMFNAAALPRRYFRSEEHTSELQSRENLVCRLLLEKKNKIAPSRIPPDGDATGAQRPHHTGARAAHL